MIRLLASTSKLTISSKVFLTEKLLDQMIGYTTTFVHDQTGIDGNKKVNGRKRHILTDTLGLVWMAVVHAAHLHDGVMAQKVVEPVLGYLHRLKKVYADNAYKWI